MREEGRREKERKRGKEQGEEEGEEEGGGGAREDRTRRGRQAGGPGVGRRKSKREEKDESLWCRTPSMPGLTHGTASHQSWKNAKTKFSLHPSGAFRL